MKKKLVFILLTIIVFVLPLPVLAKLGVGVATGKITVEDKLKPGMIYNLPVLTVLNTGDEDSKFEVGIAYHQNQSELRPKEEWFVFSPKEFFLKPGEAQKVTIKLNLPIKVEPGNYFAYLEGRPLKKSEKGQTTVGIAAATKIYFTVVSANPILGIYYKLASLWKINQPWSSRIAVILGLIIVYRLLNKNFGFQISFKSKREQLKQDKKEAK